MHHGSNSMALFVQGRAAEETDVHHVCVCSEREARNDAPWLRRNMKLVCDTFLGKRQLNCDVSILLTVYWVTHFISAEPSSVLCEKVEPSKSKNAVSADNFFKMCATLSNFATGKAATYLMSDCGPCIIGVRARACVWLVLRSLSATVIRACKHPGAIKPVLHSSVLMKRKKNQLTLIQSQVWSDSQSTVPLLKLQNHITCIRLLCKLLRESYQFLGQRLYRRKADANLQLHLVRFFRFLPLKSKLWTVW